MPAAQLVALVWPSSAAAEKVFPLLNASFEDKQQHALQDYVELWLIQYFNNH